MKTQMFRSWNWEFDYGEAPIPETEPVPAVHAVAFYDGRGRLYRVEERVSPSGFSFLKEGQEPDVYRYDYYCDETGRILQKRSLAEDGQVAIIVDFAYNDEAATLTQTAWSPDGGFAKSITRRLDVKGENACY